MASNPWGLQPEVELGAWAICLRHRALRISSGRRSAQRNKEVGGAPNSRHLVGLAVDFVGPHSAMLVAAKYARSIGATEVLIHDKGSGVHLHAAWPRH